MNTRISSEEAQNYIANIELEPVENLAALEKSTVEDLESLLPKYEKKDQAVTIGQIHHVESDQGRASQRNDFLRKNQVLFQIRSIEDYDKNVGLRFTFELAQYNLARHQLIRTGRIQRIASRKIGKANYAARWQARMASLSFNRHSGVIGNLLPCARKRVE